MSGSIAKAYVQVIPSAKGIRSNLSSVFNSEMPSAGQSAGGIFGSSMIGKIKGLFAAAGIGKIITDSLNAGGALQQSLGGVETLFKDSAATVIANAEQAYKTAGMSANQYMETVTGFSASLLQSLDGDTSAAAAAADVALKDMSDNANKMGTAMESIQNAYQGFAKQNYTMLDNLKLGYGGTKTEMLRLLSDANKINAEQGRITNYSIENLSDVYDAIHVIQNQMGITGTTAKEAASTFSGSMASMKAAFSDLMANLATGRAIGPSLEALGETVFTFVKNNLFPMIGNIFSALPEVLSSLLSMAIKSLNMATIGAKEIVTMGADLMNRIGQSIIDAAPELAAAAIGLAKTLGRLILSTDWSQLGADLISDLRDSLDVAAVRILGTDKNIVESVIQSIGAKLPDLLKNGEIMINSVVSGIFAALPGLTDSALQTGLSFISMLLSKIPDVIATGKSILMNLVNGIRMSFPDILRSAGDAVIQLVSGLIQNGPKILASGFDLVISLVKGLSSALPEIGSAVGDIARKIWETIKSTNWLQIGKDIINGLINGIGAMASALWSAAKNVAKTVLNSIKSALGIASPSTVMRDQVGKFVPSGVAVGITGNTKPLTDALHDLSWLTTDTLRMDLGLNQAGSNSVYSYSPETVTNDVAAGNAAGFESVVSMLGEILNAVLGIEIGDEVIGKAATRYQRRQTLINGGAV